MVLRTVKTYRLAASNYDFLSARLANIINTDPSIIRPMSEVKDAPREKSSIGKYVSRFLYACYVMMLLLSAALMVIGSFLGRFPEVFVTVPVILILFDVLLFDRKTVHIPPLMVFITVLMMLLVLVGRFYENGDASRIALDILLGAVMGLAGLIFTYSLIPAAADISGRSLVGVALVSCSFAISLFSVLLMVRFFLSPGLDLSIPSMDGAINRLIFVIVGTLIISGLFCISRNSSTLGIKVTNYLMISNVVLGVDDHEKAEIKKALESGEGEKVEYKSTLRMNLSTGEKDEEMERAVLKTLVAFMNSNGGTLLIGVADDKTILGVDEWSFDNRDKLNLHLTNLIGAHIGNEFLPFISFLTSDYEGKGVMRIVCKKSNSPVFLKEGKEETFFVRSGPSSIELHGTDTLNYVNNRFKKRGNGKIV